MLQSHTWKQSGPVALWRFIENQRNFPGWHLTANAGGCASLIALLDAFAIDNAPSSRVLAIVQPTLAELRVPNNRSSGITVPGKLRLVFAEESNAWSFPAATDTAELTFGSQWLAPLKEAVAGIPLGKGDFSIGLRSGERLWFWRQPAAA